MLSDKGKIKAIASKVVLRISLLLSLLFTFLINTFVLPAVADEYEIIFRDTQWTEEDLTVSKSDNPYSTVEAHEDQNSGIIEWKIEAAALRFAGEGWVELEGYIGSSFQYLGETWDNWIEVRYDLRGFLECYEYAATACSLKVEVYENSIAEANLIKSRLAFHKELSCECGEDRKQKNVNHKRDKACFFPCRLENGVTYVVILKVIANVYAYEYWFDLSGVSSDFKEDEKTLDLDKIKIWHSHAEAQAAFNIDGHPKDDDEVAIGEYMFENNCENDADTIFITSHNSDSRVKACSLFVEKFDTATVERDPSDYRNTNAKAWSKNGGIRIPPGSSVYVRLQHYLDDDNTVYVKANWNCCSSGLRAPASLEQAIPDHSWRILNAQKVGGNYKHMFIMKNEDPTNTLIVSGLSFLSTMNYYDQPSTLEYTGEMHEISLGSLISWSTEVITPDPMVGGYIYFKYNIYDQSGDSVICNVWGAHEIWGQDTSPVGDPGFYVGFDVNERDVTAGETICWNILAANLGSSESPCQDTDIFCVDVNDTDCWPISGVPPLRMCQLCAAMTGWWQEVCVTVPCEADVGDVDTVIAIVAYCDDNDAFQPDYTDCVDPTLYNGNPYYSADTVILHVIQSPPTPYIAQDSIYAVEQGQTAAYVPFTICNSDPCAQSTTEYGYCITSTGNIGVGGFPQCGSTSPVPGGECQDVYAIVDASTADPCDVDDLTIIAWNVGAGTVYDTCVQIVHVIEPVPVPVFTTPVAAMLVLAMICIVVITMKKRAANRT